MSTPEGLADSPVHQEDTSIIIDGQVVKDLPQDLYIPPDALEVFLERFQGPLDLLLYLIKKQNMDILNIPIATITHQYMRYVEWMEKIRLELAADYLVMAAALAEIKSRMLLPRTQDGEEEEYEDPRAELIRRLQEYERFKEAAQAIDEMPRVGRDTYTVFAFPPEMPEPARPSIDMEELMLAFAAVLKRVDLTAQHSIKQEPLSIRERMSAILEKTNNLKFVSFLAFFSLEEGRAGLVVTFIAILELLKGSLIDIVQTESFGPIYVKAVEYDEQDEQATADYH